MMNEEDFRDEIRAKYPNHFAHYDALHRVAEAAIHSHRSFVATAYQDVLFLIAGRSFKTYDAIRRLSEVAYSEDVGVLLRSLLNLLAVTRWISLAPDQRAKRYLDWHWVMKMRDTEKYSAHMSAERFEEIRRRFDEVRSHFQVMGQNNQLKMVRQWYQPEVGLLKDIFEKVGMTREYEEAYYLLSSIEHSDVRGFFAMSADVGSNGAESKLNMHSDLFIPHYMRNSFQWFGEIFRICNDELGMTDAAKLQQTINEGIKFFANDNL